VRQLGNRRHLAADLVEFDDAQRLVGLAVLEQGPQTLCGRQFSNVSDRWRPSWRHSMR
jgi:hypothetical protein